MSKIICDVCGTKYPDSAEQCPICGRIRVGEGKTAADSFVMDEAQTTSRPKVKGGRFSKANVRKRSHNLPVYPVEAEKPKAKAKAEDFAEDDFDEFEEYAPRKKSNAVLNVLLVIVILALLAVIGYIAVEFFLPEFGSQTPEVTEPSISVTEEATEEPTVETTTPNVPCTGLRVDQAVVLLQTPDQPWLLNVEVSPADTTDVLQYVSSDESVVTVSSEGRITAVGQGDAVITVTCGDQQINCTVAVVFDEEAQQMLDNTESTAATPEETQVSSGNESESQPKATQAPKETEASTEETKKPLKDVKLSVKKTDVTFRLRGQQATFKLTCDLEPTEVEWISENDKIVVVDENGLVTCKGKGTTNVIVKYGDQEVKIICRCVF